MERQNQIITALAVLLLALMAIVVLDKDAGKDDADKDFDAPPSRDLFAYEDKDIDKLTVEAKGATTTFEKKDGAWKMVAPSELPIDTRRVEEIVERLNTVRIEDREIDGNIADFGLAETERAIVTLSAGAASYSVVVGKDAAVGYRSYAQEKVGEPPRLLSSRVADIVHRGPDDFRSKDVWAFSSYAARRVRIEADGRSVTLRKDDQGWWVGDAGPRAEEATVTAWLQKASTLKVASFEDGGDPVALGLEPARGSIVVEDGDKSWTLTLGAGDVARVDGALVHLGESLADLLTFDGWTSKKLMTVQRYAVDVIEIQLGARSTRLLGQDGAWADASGKAVTNTDALFTAIEEVEANRDEVVAAPGETWGRIVLGEGDKRAAVLLGELRPDGRRVAREESGGPPFLVSQAGLDKLAALLP